MFFFEKFQFIPPVKSILAVNSPAPVDRYIIPLLQSVSLKYNVNSLKFEHEFVGIFGIFFLPLKYGYKT